MIVILDKQGEVKISGKTSIKVSSEVSKINGKIIEKENQVFIEAVLSPEEINRVGCKIGDKVELLVKIVK